MSAVRQRRAWSIAQTRYELDTGSLVALPLPMKGR
jgi:hypothetical protein